MARQNFHTGPDIFQGTSRSCEIESENFQHVNDGTHTRLETNIWQNRSKSMSEPTVNHEESVQAEVELSQTTTMGISLSRNNRTEQEPDPSLKEFVRKHITRKKCNKYIPIAYKQRRCKCSNGPTGSFCEDCLDGRCGCNAKLSSHDESLQNAWKDRKITLKKKVNEEWSSATHTENKPGCCGDIKFKYRDKFKKTLKTKAKYIRLREDTDQGHLKVLLERYWKLIKPQEFNKANRKLILYIPTDSHCQSEVPKTIRNSFCKLAAKTNAWILTNGLYRGIGKTVGEAISQRQSYKWKQEDVTASMQFIGIVPWGVVKDTDKLENSQGDSEVVYKVDTSTSHQQQQQQQPQHHIEQEAQTNVASTSDESRFSLNPHCTQGDSEEFDNVDNPTLKQQQQQLEHDPKFDENRFSLNPHCTHLFLVDNGKRETQIGSGTLPFAMTNLAKLLINKEASSVPIVMLVMHGGQFSIVEIKEALEAHISVIVCKGTGGAADILARAYEYQQQDQQLHHGQQQHQQQQQQQQQHTSLNHQSIKSKLENDIERLFRRDKRNIKKEIDNTFQDIMECCKYKKWITILDLESEHLDDVILKALEKDEKYSAEALLNLAVVLNKGKFAKDHLSKLEQDTGQNGEQGVVDAAFDTALDWDKADLVELFMQKSPTSLRKLTKHKWPSSGHGIRKPFPDQETNDIMEALAWSTQAADKPNLAKLFWSKAGQYVAASLAITQNHKQAKESYEIKCEAYRKKYSKFENYTCLELNEWFEADPKRASYLLQKPIIDCDNTCCLQMAADAKAEDVMETQCCQETLTDMWINGSSNAYMKPHCLQQINAVSGKSYCGLSPKSKFVVNFVLYWVFLGLYSSVLITLTQKPSILEYVVFVWVLSLFVQELCDIATDVQASKIRKSGALLSPVLFVIGFALHFASHMFSTGNEMWIITKILYSIGGIFYFLFVMRFFYVSRHLGPWLKMIHDMVFELICYMAILVVVWMTYAFTIQPLMTPMRGLPLDTKMVLNMIFTPYWALYGEVDVDSLTVTGLQCGNSTIDCNTITELNSTYNATTSTGPTAVYSSILLVFIYVLTGIYLLFGHLLLMNLLIAIFNYVYSKNVDKSNILWKFERFFLVSKYCTTPILPPPFILIEHFATLVLWLHQRSKNKLGCSVFEEKKYDDDDMHIFEEDCHRRVMKSWQKKADKKASTLGDRDAVKKAITTIDNMKKTLDNVQVELAQSKQLNVEICNSLRDDESML